MYAGPADVTFFHNTLPLPPGQLDVYFNVAVDVTLSDVQPRLVQLDFVAKLVGVHDATHVRVRLPDGLEYEGEITPWAAMQGMTSILFKLATPPVAAVHH